jgi:hypothetical protein
MEHLTHVRASRRDPTALMELLGVPRKCLFFYYQFTLFRFDISFRYRVTFCQCGRRDLGVVGTHDHDPQTR